jgi:hypothetical protein
MTMVTEHGQRSSPRGHIRWHPEQHTASVYHGGQLEAQALSERGGCLDKHILAVEGREDDLALVWSSALYQYSYTISCLRKEAFPIPECRLVELASQGEIDILQRVAPRERHGSLVLAVVSENIGCIHNSALAYKPESWCISERDA